MPSVIGVLTRCCRSTTVCHSAADRAGQRREGPSGHDVPARRHLFGIRRSAAIIFREHLRVSKAPLARLGATAALTRAARSLCNGQLPERRTLTL